MCMCVIDHFRDGPVSIELKRRKDLGQFSLYSLSCKYNNLKRKITTTIYPTCTLFLQLRKKRGFMTTCILS